MPEKDSTSPLFKAPPTGSPPEASPPRTDPPEHDDVNLPKPRATEANPKQLDFLKKHTRQEFFLPVSGFVWLYREEVEVVNHPIVQRLSRIYQLGQTYMVYRGATHKRLEHVLGAVQIVERMMDAVEHNRHKAVENGESPPKELSPLEKRIIRLGALLHDIGHLPAGHTVEDELTLVGKHDEDARLETVFSSPDWVDAKGNTLQSLVDQRYKPLIPPSLDQDGITASDLVRLVIRKPNGPKCKAAERMEQLEAKLANDEILRIEICRDMIGNTICADLLDYIYRDWYHIGKPRSFDDRLLQYMEIQHERTSPAVNNKPRKQYFVISLGKQSKLRTDAISQILDLLEWRYQLAEAVLFHRKKLAAASMLDRALFEIWGDNPDDVEMTLFPLSDEQLLTNCRQIALDRNKPVAATLLQQIENRQLYRSLSTKFYRDLEPHRAVKIKQIYAGVATEREGDETDYVRAAGKNRYQTLRSLESDFKLPEGSITMYCPAKVNDKIVEVRIATKHCIMKFHEYEDEYNEELSGGHLDAQLDRFKALWRVHFFIDPVRAGVPEKVVQQIGGWKTRSVFDRYNVVSARDFREAGERLERYQQEQQAAYEAAQRTTRAQPPEKVN